MDGWKRAQFCLDGWWNHWINDGTIGLNDNVLGVCCSPRMCICFWWLRFCVDENTGFCLKIPGFLLMQCTGDRRREHWCNVWSVGIREEQLEVERNVDFWMVIAVFVSFKLKIISHAIESYSLPIASLSSPKTCYSHKSTHSPNIFFHLVHFLRKSWTRKCVFMPLGYAMKKPGGEMTF